MRMDDETAINLCRFLKDREGLTTIAGMIRWIKKYGVDWDDINICPFPRRICIHCDIYGDCDFKREENGQTAKDFEGDRRTCAGCHWYAPEGEPYGAQGWYCTHPEAGANPLMFCKSGEYKYKEAQEEYNANTE